jgi:hypothetical protein
MRVKKGVGSRCPRNVLVTVPAGSVLAKAINYDDILSAYESEEGSRE